MEDLPYIAPFYPYGDYIAITGVAIVVIGQGVALATTPEGRDPTAWLKMVMLHLILVSGPVFVSSHVYHTSTDYQVYTCAIA